MNYVLDTNTLVLFQEVHPAVCQRILAIQSKIGPSSP